MLGLSWSPALSQMTGYLETYDDGDISRWEVDTDAMRTYQLSAEGQSLGISYTRTPSSWEWDNFHWTPPTAINVGSNPLITIRIRSTVRSELAVKPVYGDGTSSWLTYQLSGDSLWRWVSLSIPGTGDRTITRLYCYLDGGTTVSRSGVLLIDEMRLGDSAFVMADPAGLQRAIEAAGRLLATTTEGSGEGEFPAGSKAVVEAARARAENVLASGTNDQAVIERETWDLNDACTTYERNVNAVSVPLTDPHPTKQTRYLYLNLTVLAPTSLLFGMHDATGYGVGWSGDDDRSDVKSVCGDYPAVYSEDMSGVAENGNTDGVRYRLTSAYDRGGVITMCWHQLDPDGRGFYAADVNNERIVATIIPGGPRHADYKTKLNRVARFLKSLRGAGGESIPVIFRPYHEHSGSWFWWGADHATPSEYNALWQFTAHYLHDSLNVHNLLWALSPTMDAAGTGDQYFDIYPGDPYIDIFGADNYFSNAVTSQEIQTFSGRMRTMVNHARGPEQSRRDDRGGPGGPADEHLVHGSASGPHQIRLGQHQNGLCGRVAQCEHDPPFRPVSGPPECAGFSGILQRPVHPLRARPAADVRSSAAGHRSACIRFQSRFHICVALHVDRDYDGDKRAGLSEDMAVGCRLRALPGSFTGGEGGYVHTLTISGTPGGEPDDVCPGAGPFGNVDAAVNDRQVRRRYTAGASVLDRPPVSGGGLVHRCCADRHRCGGGNASPARPHDLLQDVLHSCKPSHRDGGVRESRTADLPPP